MKNQNDLIVSILSVVICLIAFFVCMMGCQRTPVRPPDPPPVVTSKAKWDEKATTPVMVNALPTSDNSSNSPGGRR